jgi:hypothetical protein
MAENDQRSYRDPPSWRSAEETPRAQADDPLAELARLIGQSVPTNKLGRDRKPAAPEIADDRRSEAGRAASYPPPDEVLRALADDRYSTRKNEHSEPNVDPGDRASTDERFEPTLRDYPPRARSSRFRQEPDFVNEPPRDAADGEADEAAYQETAEWHDQSSDERDSDYPDEYENERYAADDHGYGDEYSEEQNTGRRGGFIFVAAIFALAVLGTVGAFAYRAMFGGPALPALPPIIKAEGGPNKIMPSGANAQGSTRQADAADVGSGERLVSREERPVDISPPVTNTAPRQVSTVPVFPDPPSMGGPGAVVGYSGGPVASSPAMPTPPPPSAASVMTTTTASNPSAVQASPPATAPAVSTVTPAAPPGPKKIRTVTIHTDQSGAADAGVSPRPGAQSPQGSNAPLSIVPSSTTESSAAPPPAPARPRPAPAQPAPLNKPPANETASAAPVAPVATGGSYAVQVSSQRSEEEAQSSFRDLQAKYPDLLGGRTPIIRRADLGTKGIFFRAMVGPFTSADQATELCSNLKAAGGNCLVQKN